MGEMNIWTGPAAGLAVEELETELLLEVLFQRFGHDFRAYDRPQLRRKLAEVARLRGAHTLSGLQEQVLHTLDAGSSVLRARAVPPCGLYDDPAHAARLRAQLAPALRGWPLPRVWLAECAGLGEAWTLAILLAEEGVPERLEIHATLANEELVAEMRAGWLPEAELEQAARRHALADFGPVLRQRTLRLFHDSLARFGLLCLDRPFGLADAHAEDYQAVGDGWYKRVG
jgi:chemotaxis protein methyltransferase CheR